MTSKTKTLPKSRVVVNRNFTTYNGNNIHVVIKELQDATKDTIRALNELRLLQFGSRELEADGLPVSGSRCELLDGQYLRILQTGAAGSIVTVEHGLARKPQGVIFLFASLDNNLALLAGDPANFIPPASETSFSVVLNGTVGFTHICIVY